MKWKGKDFDCVEMKNAIQARLVARRKGMSAADFIADVERSLANSDAPIARFWRRINVAPKPRARDRAVVGR